MTQQDITAAAADPGPVPDSVPVVALPVPVAIPVPVIGALHDGLDRVIKDLAAVKAESTGQAGYSNGAWASLIDGLLVHLPSVRSALASFLEREVSEL
jgi:hypothetical protein